MFKYSAHCGPKGERTPARGRHQHQHSKNRIVRLTSSLPSLLETGLPGEKASKRNMSFKPDVLTQFQGWWFLEAGGKRLASRDGMRQVQRAL